MSLRIELSERRARLSVRDLAAFNAPSLQRHGGFGSAARAAQGTAWHEAWHERERRQHEDIQLERHLRYCEDIEGWQITIEGRVDQLLPPGSGALVREIKSTRVPLPAPPEELLARYPEYPLQLAIYLALLSRLETDWPTLSGQLLFIQADEGVSQAVPLEEDAETLYQDCLQALLAFLRERQTQVERLSASALKAPFEHWREGQEEAQTELARAAATAPLIGFQAPTGFGKTGLALDLGLRLLREQRCERILYLTGKSTGQEAALKVLAAYRQAGLAIHWYQLRNRREHQLEGNLQEHRHELPEALHPSRLMAEGTLCLERVRELAVEHRVDPYALSLSCLSLAQVWVLDYNYLFSPDSRQVLESVEGFEPSRTLLIIDEAHNLPERVASAHSAQPQAKAAASLEAELGNLGAAADLQAAARQWSEDLAAVPTADALEMSWVYGLAESAAELEQQLEQHAPNLDALSEAAAQALREALRWRRCLAAEHLDFHYSATASGEVRSDCLDASAESAATLRRFGGVLLMSATLDPWPLLLESLGQNGQAPLVQARAPWLSEGLQLAIDTRVDTRYRQRSKSYPLTCETITALCSELGGPLAVFFSSYAYAREIASRLAIADPFLRVALQEPRRDLREQERFLEEALLSAHAIFFILGSSFSESIDALGGQIERAMVVGPALPEFNGLQEARRHRLLAGHGDGEAFRRVYQVPAARKIIQAVGRLIRAPGQRAEILLHGRRFAEESYRALIFPEQEPVVIQNDEALQQWLSTTV